MKKLLSTFIASVIMASALIVGAAGITTQVAAADYPEVTVFIDGMNMMSDQAAVLMDGRTMVPTRAIAESLGIMVGWDENTQTVTFNSDSLSASMVVGETVINVTKDGTTTAEPIDAPTLIMNDRTMVPARFVSEIFGAKIGWNKNTQTVAVISSDAVKAALKQYAGIVAHPGAYKYDGVDPTGNYRYTLAKMSAGDAVTSLIVEQETADLYCARVFRYDPSTGALSQPEQNLYEGTASMGGYRGTLSVMRDGNGLRSTEADGAYANKSATYALVVLDEPQDLMFPTIDWLDGDKNAVATKNVWALRVSNIDELEQYMGQHITFSIDPYEGMWPADTSMPIGQPSAKIQILN